MHFVRTIILPAFVILFLFACKSKKKPSLSGEEPVEISDFIDFFPTVSPSYQFADSTLRKKEKDSLLISYKVFTQFVPDSLLRKTFGKNVRPRLYPMAIVKGKEEKYLFAKAVSGEKRVAYLFAFDKKDQYLDGMVALLVDQLSSTQQSAVFDRSYSLTRTTTRRNADGSNSEGKDVYALGTDSARFVLIMTDPIDDKITELINPIDTLSRKQKYTADYGSGKMNLVSIRDGRIKNRITFFIHFEKSNGACTGELKGEAMMKSSNVAEYREGGDPCVLRFTFSSSSVVLKELEGCGSHRGLRCSFDGSYPRKKETAKSSSKKVTRK